MSTRNRIRRPQPERTEPIRSGGFFGAAPGGQPAAQADGGRDSRQGDASPTDPMSRAVEIGYRVVEEYLRQGESAARSLRGGAGATPPLAGGLQDLATRWFQYTSEMTELWLQMAGLAAAAQPAAPPPGPSTPAPGPSGADVPHPERVAVAVSCTRPVEVTVDWHPRSVSAPLRAHDLRCDDPEKPRIAGVQVDRSPEGAPILRIRIPSDQLPGTYCGLLIDDETSLPAGSVAVRVP